jgi:hypothetical protein
MGAYIFLSPYSKVGQIRKLRREHGWQVLSVALNK